MRLHTSLIIFLMVFLPAVSGVALASNDETAVASQPDVDPALKAFIDRIRAVDNHSHMPTIVPDETEADVAPIEALQPFPPPAFRKRDNPARLAGYRALYGYPHADVSEAHMAELRATMAQVRAEHGDKYPEWVLDRIGTEVMLANRVAMGPGLAPPRFRWVSYVDSLMFPLSTSAEAAVTPDRQKLYPYEQKLLHRYLADLKIETLPATLDAYLESVVTATLARQRQAGCIAVKFQAGLLRSLDFAEASAETANRVYARHVAGGEPTHADYKALQDYVFRYIAREAGRLGMAVHIHSMEGPGAYYRIAESDPLLLESVFNDPTLRTTNFVIIHGGGIYAPHAGALLAKPNVYADTSAMAIAAPAALADVLKHWLRMYPEKVLFGTDAASELLAWMGTTHARLALAMALTEMMRNGEVSRARAEEIATMVMRTNAGKLYSLGLQ